MAALIYPEEHFDTTGGRSEKFADELRRAFDWQNPARVWVNSEAIAEMMGWEKTQSNLTIIGRACRKIEGVKTKRTATARFMLMPAVKI
jgi:hypothetical protein